MEACDTAKLYVEIYPLWRFPLKAHSNTAFMLFSYRLHSRIGNFVMPSSNLKSGAIGNLLHSIFSNCRERKLPFNPPASMKRWAHWKYSRGKVKMRQMYYITMIKERDKSGGENFPLVWTYCKASVTFQRSCVTDVFCVLKRTVLTTCFVRNISGVVPCLCCVYSEFS